MAGLCGGRVAWAQSVAAPPAWAVQPVRSLDPADEDFRDLEFLQQEIGDSRVVFLGEPTHGEGNVLIAKARLIRFLHQRMGFNTLAFESDFYALHKAQQVIDAGQDVRQALQQSLFPVWTQAREFEPTMRLIQTQKLRVAGFDPQVRAGSYSDNLVDELQQFVGPTIGNEKLYDVLEAGISFMAESYGWSPVVSYPEYSLASSLVTGHLRTIARQEPKRRAEAEFWVQCLASLLEQGRYYRTGKPNTKTRQTFTAQDSNPRDAQMAANLLFYTRQHPTAKIICWGASAHFANRPAALDNEELRHYQPLAGTFRTHYPHRVYSLALTGAGGYYRPAEQPDSLAVPAPPAGSLEARLASQPTPYSFINLARAGSGPRTTSYAMTEYVPVSGDWAQVFDGMLFVGALTPTHEVKASAPRPASYSGVPAAAQAPSVRPVPTPVEGSPVMERIVAGSGYTLSGTVVDPAGTGVLFASVQLVGTGIGTVANAKGVFSLQVPPMDKKLLLAVSCVGYEPVQLAVTGSQPVVVRLQPATYALAEVRVAAQQPDARRIMTRAVEQIGANYVRQNYQTKVYGRSVATNLDTLVQDVEHVSSLYNAGGYQDRQRTASMLQQVQWNKKAATDLTSGLFLGESTGIINQMDALSVSPLFEKSKLKHFTFSLAAVELKQGAEVYVLDFAAKRKSKAVTGISGVREFTGKVYINAADYAVVQCELRWVRDTAVWNAHVRNYFPRGGTAATAFHVLDDEQSIRQTVYYDKPAGGAYSISRTAMYWQERGRDLTKPGRVDLTSGVSIYFYDRTENAPQAIVNDRTNYAEMLNFAQKPHNAAFWQTYQRPVAVP
ncbi:erythromycin esterase family protein [Hymenobacter persicinus]|nr:erythromycin esterase family protein [Hymenobacter persicinus]